jgi:hypothetical protein
MTLKALAELRNGLIPGDLVRLMRSLTGLPD